MGKIKGSALSHLDEVNQKLALMIAQGKSMKEAAAATELVYDSVRQRMSNSETRADKTLQAAVQEIKTEMANAVLGLSNVIVKRVKSEVSSGDSEFAHLYCKVGVDLIKHSAKEEEKNGEGKLKGIGQLIQNFNMIPAKQPQDVVVERIKDDDQQDDSL